MSIISSRIFDPAGTKNHHVDNLKDIGILAVFAYNGFHMAKSSRKTGGQSEMNGQEDRFLKAFDEFSDALFRHATYRLSDRERAIELVHDTFTKAWSYIRDGHNVDSFKPFLYKVLNNKIIDEYRKRKELSLDAILEDERSDGGGFDELQSGGIEEITFALDAKKAATLIHEIPEAYREVIVLRFVDGLGPKEISQLIEESENVVSVRIHRGLKILRERIEISEKDAERKRMT